jgi:hypothetical protein
MLDNSTSRNGAKGVSIATDSATPRLFLVRPAPHVRRRNGQAKLERVQAYLLRQLRAARDWACPVTSATTPSDFTACSLPA